ncbi:Zn(2)-C6 fungal-type domain-containing protein [Mycena venus]|uniref:Zn(2)-C6 fungal-type domain-containing protein n=1 Tax=Mycena venus TaxID=2733690 RepID=A0A8H6YVV8_9AGAR|nr:Zn(2)-C6 fungal-type domain-containing protein [Mycena venus]
MSTPRVRQKRRLKPPACDFCKARRVLCHPQPNGLSCPRCAEKGVVCTTTPVVRGRPRKNVDPSAAESVSSDSAKQLLAQELAVSTHLVPASSSSMTLLSPEVQSGLPDCPDLTPELVAHFFECFDQLPPSTNPVIVVTSIKTTIRQVSFKLSPLPPQSRVLCMCIIAFASLVSFHEAVLGLGLLPDTFADAVFFSAETEVRNCGVRRAPVCRALHAAALKAAWDAGIMLQVSNENAAACFILDLLEQGNFSGLSRPWATAYISHVRALAPIWRTLKTPPYSSHWAGFLMAEALMSTRSRKPILVTHEDQLLLCGLEPHSQEEFLASLESSSNTTSADVLFQAMRPYTWHIVRLARELWTTITGDHIRLSPLSESAVFHFLSSLSLNHAILSHLLARADAWLAASGAVPGQKPLVLDNRSNEDTIVRGCGYGIIIGFTGLVLPLYRELEQRVEIGANDRPAYARDRLHLLLIQARDMTRVAVRELARAIRYLSEVHFVPVQRKTLCDYAQFALDEAEKAAVVDPECVQDLKTISKQLVLAGYSQDLFSAPDTASLIQRLDGYIENATRPVDYFDPESMLADLLQPLDQTWLNPLPPEINVLRT